MRSTQPSFHRARMPSGMRGASTGVTTAARFAGRDELKDEGGGCLVQPVSVVDDQNQVPVAGAVQERPAARPCSRSNDPAASSGRRSGAAAGPGRPPTECTRGPEGGEGEPGPGGGGDEPLGVNLIGRLRLSISSEEGAGQCGLPHAGGSQPAAPRCCGGDPRGRGRAAHHGRPGSPSRLPPAPSDKYRTSGGRWPLVVADVTQGVTDPAW